MTTKRYENYENYVFFLGKVFGTCEFTDSVDEETVIFMDVILNDLGKGFFNVDDDYINNICVNPWLGNFYTCSQEDATESYFSVNYEAMFDENLYQSPKKHPGHIGDHY